MTEQVCTHGYGHGHDDDGGGGHSYGGLKKPFEWRFSVTEGISRVQGR